MTTTIQQSLLKTTVLFALIAFSGSVFSQNISKITLAEAINSALSSNKDVLIASLDERVATEQHKQTQAIFLPQITASYSAMATDNALSAFGFKLQQQAVTATDFNPSLLNHPSASYDVMAKFEVKQPLLNLDMVYQRKGANKMTEFYKFKAQRTREYITFEVQKTFMQLQFAYNATSVVEDALKTARSVSEFTSNRFDRGLLQKSDLLNAQVQVNLLETKLSEANSNVQNISDLLGLLIGKPAKTTYDPSGTWDNNAITPANLLADTRADFMALERAVEASRLSIHASRASLLPRINAFALYQYNNSNLSGFGAGSYLTGVQLSWSIINGTQTRHQINERKQTYNKLATQLGQQKEQAEVELAKTQRSIHDATIRVAQQKLAVEQSEESLRILRNRYEKGLVNTTDVLQAQTQLSQFQLGYQQAILERNVTQAYLQLLSTGSSM